MTPEDIEKINKRHGTFVSTIVIWGIALSLSYLGHTLYSGVGMFIGALIGALIGLSILSNEE